MSAVGSSALISAKHSNLAQALVSKSNSLYHPRGYSALSPTFQDDSVVIQPTNGVVTPAFRNKVTHALPKVSNLVGMCWVETTLSAGADTTTQVSGAGLGFNNNLPITYGPVAPPGVDPAFNQPYAAYVRNAGDLLYDSHQVQYGTVQLQSHEGRLVALRRRLAKNDVNIEHVNAMVLGALPPGGDPETGTERVLVDAYYSGVKLYTPLEEVYFTQHRDCHWMPEAYSLDLQIISNLADLGQIVVTRAYGDVSLTKPTITDVGLHYQEITLSAAEKEQRLSLYKQPKGYNHLFSDLEPQIDNATLAGTGAGGNLIWNIALDNFRMDMREIIFCVHRTTATTGVAGTQGWVNLGGVGSYAGSYMESDGVTGSILFSPAENTALVRSFSTLVPVVDMQLFANGKQIYSQAHTDFVNRCHHRKHYHRDAQIGDPIYSFSFSQFPEDSKNACGHMSAAVLGKLILRLTVANPGADVVYSVEVWSESYNVIQNRAGGVNKALN